MSAGKWISSVFVSLYVPARHCQKRITNNLILLQRIFIMHIIMYENNESGIQVCWRAGAWRGTSAKAEKLVRKTSIKTSIYIRMPLYIRSSVWLRRRQILFVSFWHFFFLCRKSRSKRHTAGTWMALRYWGSISRSTHSYPFASITYYYYYGIIFFRSVVYCFVAPIFRI